MLLLALVPSAFLGCSETLSEAPGESGAPAESAEASSTDPAAGTAATQPAAADGPQATGEAPTPAEIAAIEAALAGHDNGPEDVVAAAANIAQPTPPSDPADEPEWVPPGTPEGEVNYAPGFVPEGGFQPETRTVDMGAVIYNVRMALRGMAENPERVISPGDGFTLQSLEPLEDSPDTIRATLFGGETFDFVDPVVLEMLESGQLVVLPDGRIAGGVAPPESEFVEPDEPPQPRDHVGDNPRMIEQRGATERITCAHPESFIITADGARVTLMGTCGVVLVEGTGTTIRLQTAQRVIATGNGNSIAWTDSVLLAEDFGTDNRIGPVD